MFHSFCCHESYAHVLLLIKNVPPAFIVNKRLSDNEYEKLNILSIVD